MVGGKDKLVIFDKILVPLDGSALAERVLPHLVELQSAFGSEVILLRVLDPSSQSTPAGAVDPVEWQIRKAEADTYLEGVASRLNQVGLSVSAVVREGKAAETTVEFCAENKIPLILLSSHGESGLTGWNVSSVVQKIILRARTSVLIVRAYESVPAGLGELHYERILIPLDGSQRAEGVLPVAAALAKANDAEVMAVRVVRKPEMPSRTPLTDEDRQLIDKLVDRNRAEASNYLADIKARFDGRLETRLVISDDVSGSIYDLVDQVEADLVMMSAHGYTGKSRWPYGGLVISFIAYGNTPLFILQDLPRERIEPTEAELAAREVGGR